MTLIYETSSGNIEEYLDELPKNAVKIDNICGKDVIDQFWFDKDSKRLIKMAKLHSRDTLIYVRGKPRIKFADGSKKQMSLSKGINWISDSLV